MWGKCRGRRKLHSCQTYLILRKSILLPPCQYLLISPPPAPLFSTSRLFPFSDLIWTPAQSRRDTGATYILSTLGDKGTTSLSASLGQIHKNSKDSPTHLWERSRNSSDLFPTAARWGLHPELFGHKSWLCIKQKAFNHLNTSNTKT